jgi:hypothetical protein
MYCVTFTNMLPFYSEELLVPHTTHNLEDLPLSIVCDCLFNIFAATYHIWRYFPPDMVMTGFHGVVTLKI